MAHTVMILTRSMLKPGPRAMIKIKRVLRYLKGTTSIGSTYSEDAENGDELTAYVDADHAGVMDIGYSTTGVVVCLAGAPIYWKSVKQTVVSVSILESEYVAMSRACPMVVYLRHLLKTISSEQSVATVVFEDNLGAVSTSRSNKITPRTKYIDIKFHHVRSLVADKVVDVKYIETGFQKADILTKSLGALKFISNRLMLLGE